MHQWERRPQERQRGKPGRVGVPRLNRGIQSCDDRRIYKSDPARTLGERRNRCSRDGRSQDYCNASPRLPEWWCDSSPLRSGKGQMQAWLNVSLTIVGEHQSAG